MSIIFIALGLFLLIKGANFFVDSCSSVAKSLGIPSLIIGLTIVAFGTSAPELAVSVTAAVKGLNDISIGNVVGSNICNILLILGLSGLVGKITATKKMMSRDFLFAIFTSIVMLILSVGFFLSGNTGIITRTSGLILLCFFCIYLYSLVNDAVSYSKKKQEKGKFKIKDILIIIISLIGIIFGGQLVVDSATDIARMLNVSDNVIALTIVAVGTSLPELVTSVVAAKKGESDIAIGNVVGSNIFNLLFILGLSGVISPITFGIESFIDIIVMLVATIEVYLIIFKDKTIGKKKGIILLLSYLVYLIYILMR